MKITTIKALVASDPSRAVERMKHHDAPQEDIRIAEKLIAMTAPKPGRA